MQMKCICIVNAYYYYYIKYNHYVDVWIQKTNPTQGFIQVSGLTLFCDVVIRKVNILLLHQGVQNQHQQHITHRVYSLHVLC